MKFIIENYWPLLKPLKIGGTTWKPFDIFKNSFNIVSALIINNRVADALSYFFSRGVKKIIELRILKSFINYNHHLSAPSYCLQDAHYLSTQF